MNKEKTCSNFKLDEWEICTYKIDWEDESCEENCLYDILNQEKKISKIIPTSQALRCNA